MKYEDLDPPSTWRLPPPGTHPRLPPSPPFARAAESQGAQPSQVCGRMTAAIVACLLLHSFFFCFSGLEIYCCNFVFSLCLVFYKLFILSYTISRSCNPVSSSRHIWCSTTFESSNEWSTGSGLPQHGRGNANAGQHRPAGPARALQRQV